MSIINYVLSPSKVAQPIGSFQNLIEELQEQDGGDRSKPKVCVIYMYASSYKVIVIK